jgi:hypothetical protein
MSAQPPTPADRALTTVEVSEALARLERIERIRADIARAEPAPASPRLSFRGWALNVWLAKNKGFVKNVLAPVSAILTGGAVLDATAMKFALGILGIGLLTILAKLGWDALDYFVSEQGA